MYESMLYEVNSKIQGTLLSCQKTFIHEKEQNLHLTPRYQTLKWLL